MMNANKIPTSNPSTHTSVSEFSLEQAAGAKRERASSVSSIESFITSYEPSDMTATKLKDALKELSAVQSSLELSQEHAIQLQSKLEDLEIAKSKQEHTYLETAKLLVEATENVATQSKVVDELKMEVHRLEDEMKKAAELFSRQEVALKDRIDALEVRLVEAAVAQNQEVKKHENNMAALQAQSKSAEANLTAEKARIVEKVNSRQIELEAVTAVGNEERKAHSKKISIINCELQDANKHKDHLLQSSSQITKNNDRHLENIKCLEKKLKEAEEVGVSSPSVTLARLENENTRSQLEEVLKEREVKQEDTMLRQGNIHKEKSAELEEDRDASSHSLTEVNKLQVGSSNAALLHAKILALEEARVIEVAVISYLFEENSFLKSQISMLQSEHQNAQELRSTTDQEALALGRELDANRREIEILAAQLVEVKRLADFAQGQVLRMEQDKLESLEALKFLETLKDLQNRPEKHQNDLTDTLQIIQEENSRLLSEIDGLKTLLAKKQADHESCQARLTEVESRWRALKDTLKTETTAHGSTRKELTSTRMKLQLSAARNDTQDEEISKLKDQLDTKEPLVQTGIQARRIWWEYAKGRLGFDGRWYDDRGITDRTVIRHAQSIIKRPDFAADAALFFLGVLNSDQDRRMYRSTYHRNLLSDFNKTTRSEQMAEVVTMSTGLRDRCRIRAGFENVYEDSDEYKYLENQCYTQFKRMMTDAELTTNSDKMKRKEVRELFDADAQVLANVGRMREIYEAAMVGFKAYR